MFNITQNIVISSSTEIILFISNTKLNIFLQIACYYFPNMNIQSDIERKYGISNVFNPPQDAEWNKIQMLIYKSRDNVNSTWWLSFFPKIRDWFLESADKLDSWQYVPQNIRYIARVIDTAISTNIPIYWGLKQGIYWVLTIFSGINRTIGSILTRVFGGNKEQWKTFTKIFTRFSKYSLFNNHA